MAELIRDGNRITVAGGQSSTDATAVLPFTINSVTGRVLTDSAAGAGTVSSVSVVSANGLAGTVATATTTPAITLSTTITGLLKGNGTAISAATPGTDYQAPITLTTTGTSGVATFIANTLNIPNYASGGSGTVNSGTAGQLTYYAGTGTTVNGNANATISNGAFTLGVATSVLGQLILSGSTSGTTTITPAVAASGTLTLPAATDTLVGKATTDTFTNKTINLTSNTLVATSAQVAAAVTDETGSGSLVFGTTPTLTTSVLLTSGFVMNWNASNVVLTQSSGVLTLNPGDIQIATAGTATTSVATNSGSQTLTNKRVTPRVGTTATSGTPTINTDTVDAYSITALAVNITSFTTNLAGTPTDFQKLTIRIKDNATPRTIAWGASFVSYGIALPTTTTASKVLTVGFIYDSVAAVWGCVAVATQP